MLKVWGRKDSSNVQKVLWCCGELSVPFERIDIGGPFGKNREHPYLNLNPNGVIPTLEDDGFVLWESNSILRYLNEKYGGGRLLPFTVEARAIANRWMDWQLSVLNAWMVPLYQGLIRKTAAERDDNAIEKASQQAIGKWQIVESYLEGGDYLAGRDFSLGDIPVGVWAHRWFNLPMDRPNLPRVGEWYQRLCQRPPYREHIMLPLS